MVDHYPHGRERSLKSRPRGDSLWGSCRFPCTRVSTMFRGVGRCLFVSCYPIIQCFGWDDCRHHHHHRHFWILRSSHSDPIRSPLFLFLVFSYPQNFWLVAEKTQEKEQETCSRRRKKERKKNGIFQSLFFSIFLRKVSVKQAVCFDWRHLILIVTSIEWSYGSLNAAVMLGDRIWQHNVCIDDWWTRGQRKTRGKKKKEERSPD